MKCSITRQLTLELILLILGTTAVFAGIQFHIGTIQGTMLFLPVLLTLIMGILIYILLSLRIRKLICQPLEEVFFYAYELSKGTFRKHDYQPMNNEVDHVAYIMNYLTDHFANMRNTPWREYADIIDNHLTILHDTKDLPFQIHDDLWAIRDNLRKMETVVSEFENEKLVASRSHSNP